MTDAEKYLKLLEELTGTLDHLNGIASKKLKAVHENDLLGLDECIRQEQALSLSLRSIEKRRETLLKALGLEGIPLSGLAANYPEDLRRQAQQTAENLRRQYDLYSSASTAARSALERGLHDIERMISQQQQQGQQPQQPQQQPPETPPGGMKTDFRA
jgi:hypothetical protein